MFQMSNLDNQRIVDSILGLIEVVISMVIIL